MQYTHVKQYVLYICTHIEYVSAVLFCFILDIMLCCLWKNENKKLLITKKKKNVCVDCIVLPLGGDKWLKFVIESRDSFKNADSSSKETSEVFMSETLKSLIQTTFS